MTLLAFDFPPWEYVVLFAAIVLGAINKAVEASKKLREKSIEAEQRGEAQFGSDLEEAREPEREAPLRLELSRRPPRPRREEPPVVAAPPPAPRPPPVVASRRPEHPIVRMLRTPQGRKNAVVLAEVLRRPGTRRP